MPHRWVGSLDLSNQGKGQGKGKSGSALTEDSDVVGLVASLESFKFFLVKLITLWLEKSPGLSHDDGSEDEEVVVLEGSIEFAGEVTVLVELVAHGELGILILWLGIVGFLASPKVAEHAGHLGYVSFWFTLVYELFKRIYASYFSDSSLI